MRQVCDLLVLAFQADVTRIATFMLAREGSNTQYKMIGVSEGHHELSHHQNNPALQAKIQKINTFHIQQFAYLLERLKSVQREIHEGFIDLVRRSRGARLKGQEKTLFSGEYWTGSRAIELGLADAIGDLRTTLRARFGDDVVTPLVSPARGWFGRVQPGVGTAGLDVSLRGGDLAEGVISAIASCMRSPCSPSYSIYEA